MENSINTLEIKNFKSIKHLKTDCNRVNVFIGKPNVGKSNILEAISVLGIHYSSRNNGQILSDFVRYEELSNIFYDDEIKHNIEINTDIISAKISFNVNDSDSQIAEFIIGDKEWVKEMLTKKYNQRYKFYNESDIWSSNYRVQPFYMTSDKKGKTFEGLLGYLPTKILVKRYIFRDAKEVSNTSSHSLLPPYGTNLFTIVHHNPELRKEITDIFKEYDLKFVSYTKESKFEIEKEIDGYITKYPYSSMADTFQRLIFYYAAIDSNKNSILVLEEPEVHSFPPYTADLAQRIIESEENQFFITTHSPYLLQSFISGLDAKQLNVFITYYENYETKIRKLTDEELRTASDFSVDLFYNLDNFVPNA